MLQVHAFQAMHRVTVQPCRCALPMGCQFQRLALINIIAGALRAL